MKNEFRKRQFKVTAPFIEPLFFDNNGILTSPSVNDPILEKDLSNDVILESGLGFPSFKPKPSSSLVDSLDSQEQDCNVVESILSESGYDTSKSFASQKLNDNNNSNE